MKLKIKDMEVSTGGILIVIMNREDAALMDLHVKDRILIRNARNKNIKTVVTLDITDNPKSVPKGSIGLMEEVLKKLNMKQGQMLRIEYARKPRGIGLIRKKLDGFQLTQDEYDIIINDIVRDELSLSELAYFVAACYTRGLTDDETARLTRAIVDHGTTLELPGVVMDKHCIGGVPNNRTTMIVVPILAAAGLKVPKTSSRAITSPSGTADTMEVLCPVALPLKKMQSIIKKIGAFIAWGGGIKLAAADDNLIQVRHAMSLDPQGMLLSSILAKKKAVDANKVLIDIPVGPNTKVKSMKHASELKKNFVKIGSKLDMQVEVITTNGKQPIGNGVGPALEARDVLYILRRDSRAPKDLENKSIEMAAILFKMAGKKNPRKLAKEILESGKAYKKFKEIIKAQGGDPNISPDKLKLGKKTRPCLAHKSGIIVDLNNTAIAHIARVAGAPLDKGAGIDLHKKEGDKIKKGETIATLYAESTEKIQFALDQATDWYTIK